MTTEWVTKRAAQIAATMDQEIKTIIMAYLNYRDRVQEKQDRSYLIEDVMAYQERIITE